MTYFQLAEFHYAGEFKRGWISFAGAGPNSRSSQFFISYSDSSHVRCRTVILTPHIAQVTHGVCGVYFSWVARIMKYPLVWIFDSFVSAWNWNVSTCFSTWGYVSEIDMEKVLEQLFSEYGEIYPFNEKVYFMIIAASTFPFSALEFCKGPDQTKIFAEGNEYIRR